MNQNRVVFVNGVRTPFVRSRSVFQKMPAATLGGFVLRETIARSDCDPKLVQELYFGIVCPPPEGTNVAREALFDSGLPAEIPCTTVNRYCASSAECVSAIAAKIQSGQIEVGMAGGAESISSIRALFSQDATDFFQDLMRSKTTAQKLSKLTEFKPKHLMPHAPGIKEPTTGLTMGQSGDLMARVFGVSREIQDKYALDSHIKAHNAWERGFYKSHVVTIGTPDGKVVDRDTDIRADTTLEKLAMLKPVFYKDGTITAGNASPLTDGASAILMMSEKKAEEYKMKPLGFLRGYAAAAIDIKKEPLLIGPVYAIPRMLKQADVSWEDIDLIEMHEAFAAQVLSSIRAIESKEFAKDKLGLDRPIGQVDMSKFNVNGGSIPLGHPFGATGVRLILQALHELKVRGKKLALVSVCAGSGLGVVMLVEAA
ncbi:MAG: acetyl-CoA C-acyltransferase [Deltaproteobacteria bacterium]|nr:acetyl-CoA C-acyltransferase [Deltaproteobacteria bacterium]